MNLRCVFDIAAVSLCLTGSAFGQAANPAPAPGHEKTLLLVTTTIGFRHAAVSLQEKLIRDYAARTHAFKVISTSDSPDFPTAEYQAIVDQRNARVKAADAEENDRPFFMNVYDGLPGSTPAQKRAVTVMIDTVAPAVKREAEAREALSAAIVSGKADDADLRAKAKDLATASLQLARIRSEAVAKLQGGPDRLTPAQLATVQIATTRGGGFGGPPSRLPEAKQTRVATVTGDLAPLAVKDGTARAALVSESFTVKPVDLDAKSEALQQADIEYALAAEKEFAQMEASPDALTPPEQKAMVATLGVRTAPPGNRRGFGGSDSLTATVTKVLQTYLNAEALKQYDAVAFLSTTGDLVLPDNDALLKWVAAGHGFVGLHSATDTLHKNPEYIRMVGAEFQTHGMFQPKLPVYNVDTASPITAGWGTSVALNEEFYLLKNYDATKVHLLLELKQQPYTGESMNIPISWIKMYGQGRVFYTSLGHRDDVLFDAAIGDQEFKKRYNSAAVAKAVDEHILNGIRWSLGLIDADATPQAH